MKISINNLSKVYKNGTKALENINLEISNGMFGLVGPNGAGKTTLMRIISTIMEPSSGSVSMDGLNIRNNRAEIRGFASLPFGGFAFCEASVK